MKNTLIVMSSNREIEPLTRESLEHLTAELGGLLLLETGSSDVAFARCRALSHACERLREFPERDVVLMVDDDMLIPPESALAVVEHARARGVPASAMYCTATTEVGRSRLAAERWGAIGQWLTGLGCLAIPRAMLLELEQRSESFESLGRVYTAFTSAGAHEGKWIAEDYRLCIALGGVALLPVAVGHVKKYPLWPDQRTIQAMKEMNDEQSQKAEPAEQDKA
jgi:hypothetical protein